VKERQEFVASLIGMPYKANTSGPETIDCWHLVRLVRERLFEDVLPMIEVPNEPSLLWLAKAFERNDERKLWQEIEQPASGLVNAPDGSLVLMSKASQAVHVGIWLGPERCVLHATELDGVVFQDIPVLKACGWNNLRFFERVH